MNSAGKLNHDKSNLHCCPIWPRVGPANNDLTIMKNKQTNEKLATWIKSFPLQFEKQYTKQALCRLTGQAVNSGFVIG